jgi:uncharacterized membrane protein
MVIDRTSMARMTFLGILAATVLWCGLILAAPLVTDSAPAFSRPVYQAFHRVCHQFEDRSFHLSGRPLPVCVRCTSIYFAFLLGVIAYPLIRRWRFPVAASRFVVMVAVLPMVVDVAADLLGVHEVTTSTRIITGSLFGFAITFVVLPAAIEAVWQIVSSSHIIHKRRGTTDA